MGNFSINTGQTLTDVPRLAGSNPVTSPAAQSGGGAPAVKTPQAQPKAGEIKYEWEQSVAKLNQEIKELRDAMQDLLRDIRSLIANYEMETQLKPIADSLDSGLQHLTDAFGSTDKLLTDLKKVNTQGWRNDAAAQTFHNSMEKYSSRVNEIMQGYVTRQNALNFSPQLEVPQTSEGTPTRKPLPVPPLLPNPITGRAKKRKPLPVPPLPKTQSPDKPPLPPNPITGRAKKRKPLPVPPLPKTQSPDEPPLPPNPITGRAKKRKPLPVPPKPQLPPKP